MEQAIKKAIEGGYKFEHLGETHSKISFPEDERNVCITYLSQWKKNNGDTGWGEDRYWISYDFILLDPLFWQALGKAEEWKDFEGGYEDGCVGWLYHWHSLIDHLADGKDIDSFFKSLLKDK